MKIIARLRLLIGIVGAAGMIMSGCNLSQRLQPTPTLNLTEVYATLAVMMTTQPALTPSANQSQFTATLPVATRTPARASATTAPSSATQSNPTSPCDLAAPGQPIDVTIPDNTLMKPGEAFTKIWRLQNAGSCTWTTTYTAAFFYGDRMDAPASVPFRQAVPPGATVEIAVEMIAPLIPGTYQGNWKLSNANGILFGIGPNGDAPFWVRIIVSDTLPGTPSPTSTLTLTPVATATPSPSPTATPPVSASDSVLLVPSDQIDLDTLDVTALGADLGYQTGANSYHFLMPMSPTLLGVYGSLEPGLTDCQTASMSSAPIAVESLSIGTYLCYRTDLGATGRARLAALDTNIYTLVLELLTWALP